MAYRPHRASSPPKWPDSELSTMGQEDLDRLGADVVLPPPSVNPSGIQQTPAAATMPTPAATTTRQTRTKSGARAAVRYQDEDEDEEMNEDDEEEEIRLPGEEDDEDSDKEGRLPGEEDDEKGEEDDDDEVEDDEDEEESGDDDENTLRLHHIPDLRSDDSRLLAFFRTDDDLTDDDDDEPVPDGPDPDVEEPGLPGDTGEEEEDDEAAGARSDEEYAGEDDEDDQGAQPELQPLGQAAAGAGAAKAKVDEAAILKAKCLVVKKNRSTEEKWTTIDNLLKKFGMRPEEWIRRWVRKGDTRMYHRRVKKLIDNSFSNEEFVSTKLLRRELRSLIHRRFFDEYQPKNSMVERTIDEMDDVIARFAPNWREFLIKILPNQRAAEKGYTNKDKKDLLRKRRLVVTSIVVHSMAKRSSSWWSKALGIFLVGSGCPQRVISVLQNMGLTHSYPRIVAAMMENADVQFATAKVWAAGKQWTLVYDNFNRQAKRKHQVVGDVNQQVNMTTSYIARFPASIIPADGLKKSMFHPSATKDTTKELNPLDILKNVATDPYKKKVAMFFIFEAIEYVFGDAMKVVFEKVTKDNDPRPQWPEIERLKPTATELISLPASMHDEISTAGTRQVHKDFFNFLGLTADDFEKITKGNETIDNSDRLFLVHGDQLTVDRVLGIQAESVESQKSIDRRDMMLAVSAWFHIFMNCCYTLLRTHWHANKEGKPLDHCLITDEKFLGMKGVSKESPKFYIIQSLVVRSFRARVAALFMQKMEDDGLLPTGTSAAAATEPTTTEPTTTEPTATEPTATETGAAPQDQAAAQREKEDQAAGKAGVKATERRRKIAAMDKVNEVLKQQKPDKIIELCERVFKDCFTGKAWSGKPQQPDGPVPDDSFVTMSRMLQETVQFLTVRKAVRMMDIGHLRRAVDFLILPFLGAGQSNYGREMIRMRTLLDDKVADKTLQRAILATGVISHGKSGSAVAADEELEFHNGEYSKDINQFKNSTHDMEATFRKISGNRVAMRKLRDMWEGKIGTQGTTYHTEKSSVIDIFSMASKIKDENLAKIRPNSTGGRSDDILQLGTDLLHAKVDDQNRKYRDYMQGIPVTLEVPLGNDPINDADARERTEGGDRGPLKDAVVDEGDELHAQRAEERALDQDDLADLFEERATDAGGGVELAFRGLAPESDDAAGASSTGLYSGAD